MPGYVEEVNRVWGLDPAAAREAREDRQLHEGRELGRAEELRAATLTSLRDAEVQGDELREEHRAYQAHQELLGLRMKSPPAPKLGQEVPVARQGGTRAPPFWCLAYSKEAVHVIRTVEPSINLAVEPRSVARLRDSHERMNDERRMHGTPLDVLGLEPGKPGKLPIKPPPSREQQLAYHRSLNEQRQIVGGKVVDASGRWLARRREEREEAAREEAA